MEADGMTEGGVSGRERKGLERQPGRKVSLKGRGRVKV